MNRKPKPKPKVKPKPSAELCPQCHGEGCMHCKYTGEVRYVR